LKKSERRLAKLKEEMVVKDDLNGKAGVRKRPVVGIFEPVSFCVGTFQT